MPYWMKLMPLLVVGSLAFAVETKAPAPIEADEVLVMKHTGGWGAGLLAEFRLKANGDFQYTEWARPQQAAVADAFRGRMTEEQIKALVRAVADAKDGLAAEDAGVVEFAWRDGDKVGTRLYSLPRAEPAAGLLAAIKQAAAKAAAPPPGK